MSTFDDLKRPRTKSSKFPWGETIEAIMKSYEKSLVIDSKFKPIKRHSPKSEFLHALTVAAVLASKYDSTSCAVNGSRAMLPIDYDYSPSTNQWRGTWLIHLNGETYVYQYESFSKEDLMAGEMIEFVARNITEELFASAETI